MERILAPCAALALVLACDGPRVPCYWAADRGGRALVALDSELCVLERVPAAGPRAVVASGSRIWAACGDGGALGLPGLLEARASGGAGEHTLVFAGILDLAGGEHGSALIVDRASERLGRVWRVDVRGVRVLLGEFPGARAVAAGAGEVLVGCADGTLVRLAPGGAVRAFARVPGPVLDLAPGPAPHTWWVLAEAAGGALVQRLDAGLEPRWSVQSPLLTRAFAPVSGEDRVWLADAAEVRRYGPQGELEIRLELRAGRGPCAAVLATRERALLLTLGALFEVVARGPRAEVRHTQGGFAALTTLSPAPLRADGGAGGEP